MPLKTFIQKAILATSGNTVINKGLDYYLAMMKAGTPFTFSRYGDGEWSAVLGYPGGNCDGHRYFPELGAKLRTSLLERRDYLYALQPRAIRSMRKDIQAFLRKNHMALTWHNADVFHDSNKRGRLFPLISALRSMKVVMIGPAHLRDLNKEVFQYTDFIEVPSQNCFLALDEINKNIRASARVHAGAVFAFSASMTAKVLMYDLFPLLGSGSWLIDFGSLWDIYVGIKSRNVYSKRDWAPILKKNLNG